MIPSHLDSALYHPQEIIYHPGYHLEHPFPVHHLTGNLYDETKSSVESLTQLQNKLLNWLKTMTSVERQERLTFVSRDFVNLIKKMYIRRSRCSQFVFRLDENPMSKQLVVEGRIGQRPCDKNISFKAQEDLLKGIVLYHRNEPFDSISISEDLAQNIEGLFELFSTIVDGIAFEITEEDCQLLEQQGPERFFYESLETPFYLQGLGKLLVSVFTQQLWCEYYRNIRDSDYKKPKDKYRKKINNFWKDLTASQKLQVLGANNPQYFLQKLREGEAEDPGRRVPKFVSKDVLTAAGVEKYLKQVTNVYCKDFYQKMRVCSLSNSYTQESELGWFIVGKIKEHLQRRFEDLQRTEVQTANVFSKKGKQKKKKEANKEKAVEVDSPKLPKLAKSPKPQEKKVAKSEMETKTFQEDIKLEIFEIQTQQKTTKQMSKQNKSNNYKRKRPNKRKITLALASEEDSVEKSKQETSTGSPRASEVSNEPKPMVSQSDVEVNQKEKQNQSEHEPSCCEFDRNEREETLEIEGIVDIQENVQEVYEPTQHDYLRRQAELQAIRESILDKTVEDYSLKLRQHAYQFQYSRMVAFNRLHYMISSLSPTLSVYGSWATGFILADSDIDVAINPFILSFFLGYYGTMRDKIVAALSTVRGIIQQREWVKVYRMLDQAQVPVLKFNIDTSKPFQLSSDVYYNVPKESTASVVSIDLTIQEFESSEKVHVGLLASGLMNEWKERYPCVLPICITIKQLLRKKKMGEVYTGGLSPYYVIIMLVAFLKHSGLGDSSHSGSIMVEFLTFYSTQFNYKKTGINATSETDSPFFSKQESEGLMIIEPISRRVIKSTYSMLPSIMEYFRLLRDLLLDSTKHLEEYRDPRVQVPEDLCERGEVAGNVLEVHCSIE